MCRKVSEEAGRNGWFGERLKKLDRLTQEEARMANAEVLRLAHSIRDGVEIVEGKVDEVGDKVGDVGDKVQVVIDGARDISGRSLCPSNIFQMAGKQE